jgi:glycosyltransferase involved in cell wall biosynthesis
MRILYLTPSLQHPSMRGPARHYYFIRELARRHAITLLTLARSEASPAVMREMAAYTERMLVIPTNGAANSRAGAHTARRPNYGERIKHAWEFRQAVQQMKQAFASLRREHSFDLVLFHGKDIFPVIEDCHDLPVVVDFCDATSMRIRHRMRYAPLCGGKLPWLLWRYWQIRRIEKKLLRKSPHRAFVSWRDREAILGAGGKAEIVPIGVDAQYWKRKSPRVAGPNCLVFTGVMNYAPNEDAAIWLSEKILPLIRQAVPHPEVFIVGRDPSSVLREKARRHPEVTVTGFVEDVRPYLERASVFVAPLRFGSGVQNKILEAMAMQAPVITTPLAAAGLRVDGVAAPPVCVADGEKQFAERVVELLQHEKARARLAEEGRQFVENHFVWSRSAEKLEQMCLAALGPKNPRGQASVFQRQECNSIYST